MDETKYVAVSQRNFDYLQSHASVRVRLATEHVAVKRELLEEISAECAKCYKIMGGNIEHAATQYGYGLIWSKLRALLSQKGE